MPAMADQANVQVVAFADCFRGVRRDRQIRDEWQLAVVGFFLKEGSGLTVSGDGWTRDQRSA